MSNNVLTYRPDIDGLRALAVLCVLFFHAFSTIFPGGFIGVDIFFVISGYLISKIIFISLEKNDFSLINFLSRRVLRIFPALLIVILIFIVLGVQLLYIDELNQLYKHALSGLLFISNHTYSQESGYFDLGSETKPFLHLWSLAIEEQFYLIWPVLLIGIYKLQPKKLCTYILILIIVSFAWNIVQNRTNFAQSYYSLFCRAWELLLGAWLSIRNTQQNAKPYFNNDQASALGVIFIITGLIFITPNSVHPGVVTLLPVCGCALLIYAGPDAPFNRSILANKWLVAIGKVSFPLYLWHWSILSFWSIQFGSELSVIQKLAALLISFVLAGVTFRFVESPIRRTTMPKRTAGLLILVAVGLGAFVLYLERWGGSRNGFALDAAAQQFYAKYANEPSGRWLEKFESEFRHECNFFQVQAYYEGNTTNVPRAEIAPSCFTADPTKEHRVLIWGDSHAQMLNSGLARYLPTNWQRLQIASSGCTPSINARGPSNSHYCLQSNWFALETVKHLKPDVVIVAQSQGHNVAEMKRTSDKLLSLGAKKILFMGPSPHWTSDLPKIVVRRLWPNIPERTKVGLDVKFMILNERLKSKFVNTGSSVYVDLIDLFCNTQGCLVYLDGKDDFELTSWDYGHLTQSASDYVAKHLIPLMTKK